MTFAATSAPEITFETQVRMNDNYEWSVKMSETFMYRLCPFRMNLIFKDTPQHQRCSAACSHCTITHQENGLIDELILTCTSSMVRFKNMSTAALKEKSKVSPKK